MHERVADIFRNVAEVDSFRYRPSQQAMAEAVAEALGARQPVLVEAGTGVGKTLAYLVPALLFALEHGGKVIVSTKTLSLQQQLLKQDIPKLEQLLGISVKVAVAKGWGNYGCSKRSEEVLMGRQSVPASQKSLVFDLSERILSDYQLDFQKADCYAEPWSYVAASPWLCTRRRCSFFMNRCGYYEARQELDSVDLIITNHALFFSHLALLKDRDVELLPSASVVVLDECHHVPSIAAHHLGKNFGLSHHLAWLEALAPETLQQEAGGVLLAARHLIVRLLREEREVLRDQIDQVLLPGVKTCRFHLKDFFLTCRDLFGFDEKRQKMSWNPQRIPEQTRLLLEQRSAPLILAYQALAGDLNRLADRLSLVATEFPVEVINELEQWSRRLNEAVADYHFCVEATHKDWVGWYEDNGKEPQFTLVPLEVGSILKDHLYPYYPRTVLCSASLSVAGDLSFVRTSLGLDDIDEKSLCLASPFALEDVVFGGCPDDLPAPNAPDYIEALTEGLAELIESLEGRTFVLATSWSHVHQLADALHQALPSEIEVLVQGQRDSHQLVHSFCAQETASVLIGTESFWEGVDIPGPSLSAVVITRIPFRSPEEPFVKARQSLLKEQGSNPFEQYLLPDALLRLRQGFGRLIRRETDRGLFFLLDNRVWNKSYGSKIIQSFSPMKLKRDSWSELVEEGILWLKNSSTSYSACS